MKAAVFREVNVPMEVEEVQLAKPGPREVLVRTAAVGVCHSDLHYFNGTYPGAPPMVLGHEAAGVVEEVGADVQYVRPGDHVISCLSVFCGHCEHCLTGRMNLCQEPETKRKAGEAPRISQNGAALEPFANLGAFAEQMLVHEHALAKIRADMPLDRAALIGCAVTTGVGSVIHTAKVRPGETLAVIGCGGIGLSCINGAAIAGAGRIIAVDTLAAKLELARKFGATDVINAKDEEAVGKVMALTDGGVHHAFEAIGLKATAEQAWQMLKHGGTATIIGMIPPGEMIAMHGVDFLFEKKIQGSFMGSNRFRVDMPRFVEFYMQGKLHLDEMVSNRIHLSEVNDAMQALEIGEATRSVILFDAA